VGDDFDDRSSDIDLLVEFEEMSFPDRGDAYLGLLVEAETLLGRPVDLLELGAVRNPYLRQGIEASRQLLYAASAGVVVGRARCLRSVGGLHQRQELRRLDRRCPPALRGRTAT
jgi:hypothetical protein